MKTYKILLFNVGYCSGLDGSWFDYIFRSHRYLFPPKEVVDGMASYLNQVIYEEGPDVICLLEIRKGQIDAIMTKLDSRYRFYDFESKYLPNGLTEALPVLGNHYNGFIAKDKIDFKKFFIKNGSKKLMYEMTIGGVKVFLFHFALGKQVRALQFSEIKNIIKKDQPTIICGDFNTFKGLPELRKLIRRCNLKVCHKIPTFPAYNPKKAIDLVVASKSLKVESQIIKSSISDHLPVLLKVIV